MRKATRRRSSSQERVRLSADNCSSLFESFSATISRSDSSATCMRGLRLAPSPAGLCFATGVAEVSRFSCGEFAGVHGFPRPRRARAPLAKTRHAIWPSPFAHRVGARNSGFRGSIAGPPAPLSNLRLRRRRRQRMTRGQRGSLLLHRGALSSPTPRRFIPALSRKLLACRVENPRDAWRPPNALLPRPTPLRIVETRVIR